MFRRFDNLKRILQLDPKTEHQQIVYLVGAYEYPWLIQKSLEFALFRTYAVPHTSRILAASGQFERHGQKRYDDTALMLAGLAEHGYDSPFGQVVIERMNALHGRWNIKNEDMLYVLSTFIYEPIRWHTRFGWRKPTHHENLANYYFWVEVGKRMGIEDIPDTYEAFEQFNQAHEARYFAYDDANHAIAEATMGVFLSWYPAFLHPLIRQVVYGFLDEPLRKAFGYPKANPAIKAASHAGLWMVGRVMRFMPPRRTPFHFTELPTRTYPQGFQPEELGARYEG
jgi:hypothetical protein